MFTNRCRLSFESILYFYQSGGLLSQPKNVYCSTFIEEVNFFQVIKVLTRLFGGRSSSINSESGFYTDTKCLKSYLYNFPPVILVIVSMLYSRVLLVLLILEFRLILISLICTMNRAFGTGDEISRIKILFWFTNSIASR